MPEYPSGEQRRRPVGTTGLLADLRHETTAMLRQQLGDDRLHELRVKGGTMNTDDAVAYALEAITGAIKETTDGANNPSGVD